MRRLTIALGVLFASAAMFVPGAGSGARVGGNIGPLPKGRVATITTRCGEFVAEALPNYKNRVWRIAGSWDIVALHKWREGNVDGFRVFIFIANSCNSTQTITFALVDRANGYTVYKARTLRVRITK